MKKRLLIVILAFVVIVAIILFAAILPRYNNDKSIDGAFTYKSRNTYTINPLSTDIIDINTVENTTLSTQTTIIGSTPFVFNENNPDYREAMRQWVITIGEIARKHDGDFLLIPQNCAPLLTDNGESSGEINLPFISAIDGIGVEGISYGNDKYNRPRQQSSKEELLGLLDVGTDNGLVVLAVDYCEDERKVQDAMALYDEYGYIGFVAPSLDLIDIPDTLIMENAKDILTLGDAENLLYLLNPEGYESKEEVVIGLSQTNYDVIIMDAFYDADEMLDGDDVARLKVKANGASRLVIAYLSIGEAEDYRYYWEDDYYKNPPEWMLSENPRWAGNYPVKYWDENWQEIIATGENSYLKRILDAGFDGAYLDIVDGYETFEDTE